MPLNAGWSREVIQRNIKLGVREGKPAAVASAAAYCSAREWYRRKHPRGPFPAYLIPKKPGKRPITKRNNPAPDRAELERAARAYTAFHGETPKEILTLEIPPAPRTAVSLGICVAVVYRGVRDGKTYHFKHTFRKLARPYLCFSSDGRQLFLLGGDFRVTDRGITDRGP